MTDNRPIGFFDSGVGGLSLWQVARELLPSENMVVVADGSRFPYGAMTPEQVRDRACRVVRSLTALDVKLVVVACNTASVHALTSLRATFPDLPFVGVVPMVKTLAEQTHSGIIAVLSTSSTADSDYLAQLVEEFAPGRRMLNVACVGLADLVEEGEIRSSRTLALLETYLAVVKATDADVLGLGCTHYLFLRDAIQESLGSTVRVYDPALPVMQRLRQVLAEREALGSDPQPRHQFFTTGDRDRFTRVSRKLLGAAVPAGRPIAV